jgi:hypothetical protein
VETETYQLGEQHQVAGAQADITASFGRRSPRAVGGHSDVKEVLLLTFSP